MNWRHLELSQKLSGGTYTPPGRWTPRAKRRPRIIPWESRGNSSAMGTCCGALHPRAWCSAKGSRLGQVGLFGAQVGSERRTYELLSLRPTIQGGQVGPKWRQVAPKCRQNVSQKWPKCSHKFPTRFPRGVLFTPPRNFREHFWVRSREKADLLQA